MPSYRKNEARDWAWQHLKGCANVIIPSYTADLKGLNERGVRHDVRKSLEHGFAGTLLVSETALTLPEYAATRVAANVGSYARDEAQVLAHPADVRALADDTALLAARIDALDARVHSLAERLAAPNA